MVLAAPPIRKLRIGGRSRRNADFRRWERPVSPRLHRGLAAPGYDFALGIGDELISYTVTKPRKSPTRYYTHSNHLFSIAATTNASGQVVEKYSYNAYGVRTVRNSANAVTSKSAVGQDSGFTGQAADSETGMMYFKTRMYSPAQGRFTSRDSIDYYAGLNFYEGSFVPNFVDPDGECPWCLGALALLLLFPDPVGTGPGEPPPEKPSVGDTLSRLRNPGGSIADQYAPFPGMKKKDRRKQEKERTKKEKGKDKDYEEPASEEYAKWKAKQVEKEKGKDARRECHDKKVGPDRSKKELDNDYEN